MLVYPGIGHRSPTRRVSSSLDDRKGSLIATEISSELRSWASTNEVVREHKPVAVGNPLDSMFDVGVPSTVSHVLQTQEDIYQAR